MGYSGDCELGGAWINDPPQLTSIIYGYIETRVKKANGCPTTHYRINFEKLAELIRQAKQNEKVDNDSICVENDCIMVENDNITGGNDTSIA